MYTQYTYVYIHTYIYIYTHTGIHIPVSAGRGELQSYTTHHPSATICAEDADLPGRFAICPEEVQLSVVFTDGSMSSLKGWMSEIKTPQSIKHDIFEILDGFSTNVSTFWRHLVNYDQSSQLKQRRWPGRGWRRKKPRSRSNVRRVRRRRQSKNAHGVNCWILSIENWRFRHTKIGFWFFSINQIWDGNHLLGYHHGDINGPMSMGTDLNITTSNISIYKIHWLAG